jgi:hypothetical protein|tara:strand:+ start:32088 stop:32405 length:318 start_codon:yes stop_codon:yes gene_type:complete
MKNGKKIVRTKTVHKNDIGDYFEIQVMTYAKFIQRSQYKFVETDFILFPYKWYDLRWLVDKPYFFLNRMIFNSSEVRLGSRNSILMRLCIFFGETILAILLGKLF